jgi:hypothetical protein
MPITQGFVQLPDDSANTGKKEDHVITDNGQYREVITIGGPEVDAERAPVSATAGLKVDLGADNDVTVTGSVTANAGTNLNTSLLALEAGGNLAASATVLGTTTDAAVVGDNNGTLSAKLRGLSKILNDVWDSASHFLKVSIQNATLAVTQSGTWNITNVSGTVSLPTGASTETTLSSVSTAVAIPTTILNGKTTVTTAGTRVTLAGSTACKSVTIKALIANTGVIYVGNSSVSSSNGFALQAGDSVSLNITNLTTVNLDSSVNGEGVTYLGVN